jgi:protein O-GlcNAc transferase
MKHVFICGCGHSGTSLMLAMLSTHTNVHGIEVETGCFLSDKKGLSFLDRYTATAAAHNKTVLCEKTPRHVQVIGKLLDSLPEARIIVMLRNPLDVAASLRKRTGNLTSSIRRWIDDNTAWIPHSEDHRVIIVRYENLVAYPDQTLRGVCSFLELEYQEEMLDYHQVHRLYFGAEKAIRTEGQDGVAHVQLRNWQLRQPLTNFVGDWRTRLSPDEVAHVLRESASLAAKLGYSRSHSYMGW